jgi:hypothetical protein
VNFTFRKPKQGKTLRVDISLTLSHCTEDPAVLERKLRMAYDTSSSPTAALNTFLLRAAKASLWDLTRLSVRELGKEKSN